MKPVGVVAFLLGMAGLLAHYLTVGPREPGDEGDATPPPSSAGEGGKT
jgi:hypothetical protein